jgi:competence protein ComEA
MSRWMISFAMACATVGAIASAQEARNPRPAQETRAGAPLNLNNATAAELEALPGIGAQTAARIVEHRQKIGGFKKIEELLNVRGIGEKSFLKLKPLITVGPVKNDKPAASRSEPRSDPRY